MGLVAMLASSATNMMFPRIVGKVLDRTTQGTEQVGQARVCSVRWYSRSTGKPRA
jgi:hypothetical protein